MISRRLEQIKDLKTQLKEEEQVTVDLKSHIKHHAIYYVLLRWSLWNLHDILRHVDRPVKALRLQYPNSYLKLPLLKFEMLVMRAYPPDLFEENSKF